MEPLLKKHPPIIPLQLWHVEFKISDSCRKERESTLDLAKGIQGLNLRVVQLKAISG